MTEEQTQIGFVLLDGEVQSCREADEVSITSTAGGIMPVCSIDGEPVGVAVLAGDDAAKMTCKTDVVRKPFIGTDGLA